MATVTFYLKDAKGTKETPINMYFSYGNLKPFKYATGERIAPANWNPEKQMIRDKKGVSDAMIRNETLDRMRKAIVTIYRRLIIDDLDVSDTLLRELLDIEMGRKKADPSLTLLHFAKSFSEKMVSQKNSNARIVTMAYNNLTEYCSKKKTSIDFKDMDMLFRDRFNRFLQEKGYAQNSISTCFSALKIILTAAKNAGINKFLYYRDRDFSAKRERVRKYSLSYDELLAIHKKDLSNFSDQYDDIRDLFLIGAFTGMRFSDFSKLKPESFADGMITRKTKKTGNLVTAPMHWIIQEILDKRGGQMPRIYCYDTFNKGIKEIARICGVTQPVILSYTKGGERVDEIVEKWQAVSTHAARRSGVRMMRKQGIDREKIMLITGHESISSFRIYEDVEQEENALALMDHAFFKKPV
ncbi:site-specific integrase [Dyadobacter sp. CY261]|uniref:phage integrase SAM-like domain-containing protein n=1 Tax=Dyadobacter sp. CY261 TaxID=2907203 RepID=UPI001F2D7C96|nr:phage integrase SAM-like domain-containing protein [Dyadobacter sp. CY261]MCF0070240.1 site-specific integrase [Dyadobacter sp. CY261]